MGSHYGGLMAPPGGFDSPPDFVTGSALLEGAYGMAVSAHHGPRQPRRHAESTTRSPSPGCCDENGFPEAVVAAALLHDVIEDTATERDEIEAEFGAEVAELVGEMTEDSTISAYRERKAEHRGRVAGNSCVAAIYAADKLAKVRRLNETGEQPEGERLDHYRRTLVELRAAEPSLPFLSELADELDRLAGR